MNLLRYRATPMKLLTLETWVGTNHFMMASILTRSIFISPPPITYPRYTKDGYTNLHYLRFPSSWCFFNVSITCIKCEICSPQVALYTIISSKYTITYESMKGHSISFINIINLVGALRQQNGITNHWYKPCLGLKTIFHVSSLTRTWWYQEFKSRLLKYFSCCN